MEVESFLYELRAGVGRGAAQLGSWSYLGGKAGGAASMTGTLGVWSLSVGGVSSMEIGKLEEARTNFVIDVRKPGTMRERHLNEREIRALTAQWKGRPHERPRRHLQRTLNHELLFCDSFPPSFP